MSDYFKTLIENHNKQNNEVLYAQQKSNGKYHFKTMKNQSDFIKLISENDHHLYEIIETGKPRKFYLDIEFPISKGDSINDKLNKLKIYINKQANKHLNIEKFITSKNIAISRSSGLKISSGIQEYSYHLVINSNYYFKDEIDIKKFMNFICDDLQNHEEYNDLVSHEKFIFDMKVYTGNRQWRSINQTKISDPRRLIAENFKDDLEKHLVSLPILSKDMIAIDTSNLLSEVFINLTVQKGKKAERKKLLTGWTNSELIIDTVTPPNNFDINNIEHVLNLIPNSGEHYQPLAIWVKIGRALSDIVDDEVEKDLIEIWERWTTQDKTKHYNKLDCQKWFNYFRKTNNKIKRNTLFYFARLCNPKAMCSGYKKKSILEMSMSNLSTNIKVIKQQTTPDSYYLCSISKLIKDEGYNFMALSAHMGVGKSTAISKTIIEIEKFNRVLVISPKISYGNSIIGELNRKQLGFSLYTDKDLKTIKKKEGLNQIRRLVIQVHSLHHLIIKNDKDGMNLFKDYDLIVMDECEEILGSLTSQILRYHEKVYTVFERLMTQSGTVIFCDANLSDTTLEIMDAFKQGRKSCIVLNDYQPFKCKIIQYPSDNFLASKILKDLGNGKKIFIYSDYSNVATSMYEQICKNFPEKNAILYTKDRPKTTLSDVNKNWSKLDVVITSPTISVGINFDKDHFDSLYCFTHGNTALPVDITQALRRCRCIKDNVVHLTIPNDKEKIDPKHPLLYSECVSRLDTYIQTVKELNKTSKFPISNINTEINWKDHPEYVKKLLIRSIVKENNKINNFNLTFKYYLARAGFFFDSESLNIESDLEKFILPKGGNRVPFMFINTIDEEEHHELMMKNLTKDLTHDEINQILKYNYRTMCGDNGYYFDELYSKLIFREKFYNLYYESRNDLEKEEQSDIIQNEYLLFSKGRKLKLECINKLLDILKINNTCCPHIISTEDINLIKDDVNELYTKYQAVFNENPVRSNKNNPTITISQINNIFRAWGITKYIQKQKRIQKKINGKLTTIEDISYYELETIIKKNAEDPPFNFTSLFSKFKKRNRNANETIENFNEIKFLDE